MNAPNTAVRTLLVFGCYVAVFATPVARSQQVQVESALVESATGKTTAVSQTSGNMDSFFSMQKKIVYSTLEGLGIDMSSLPPEVRTRLAQFQTRNFDAFKAFANGLNARDEGRFAEARAFFKRAVELDPSFAMAREQEAVMPQSDTHNQLQLQAVLRDAVKNATQAGKDSVAVDVAHAAAALAAGINVVLGPPPAAINDASVSPQVNQQYSSNAPGTGDKFGARTVVGVSYQIAVGGANASIASTNDWAANQVVTSGNQLLSFGDRTNFQATLGGATVNAQSVVTLSDGTLVNWGVWNSTPSASATITNANVASSAPALGGQLGYMYAASTTQMPSSGTATFTPNTGLFGAATGTISADFLNRQITLNNLGFTLGSYTFSSLTGSASYAAASGSGFFSGNYSGGSCTGCVTAFVPTASAFTGNFVGKGVGGLIYSTIMQTGTGTVSGVHLFSR